MRRYKVIRRFSVVALSLWICTLAFLPHIAAAEPPDRAQAEQEIRKAIYELGAAQASGDVETIRRLTAKRTLELYRFAIDTAHAKAPSLLADSGNQRDGDPDTPKPRNEEEFFAFMIRTASASAGQFLTPEQIKQMLRAEAERPIIFLNDGKARISAPDDPASFAVFEDGRWKIDYTETVKSELLSLEKFPFMNFELFTPEQKKRIKKF
jgi:hypothetical protein